MKRPGARRSRTRARNIVISTNSYKYAIEKRKRRTCTKMNFSTPKIATVDRKKVVMKTLR